MVNLPTECRNVDPLGRGNPLLPLITKKVRFETALFFRLIKSLERCSDAACSGMYGLVTCSKRVSVIRKTT